MRECWVDNVRGFAIYLMVLGHCIQYASHEGYSYIDNGVFHVIYSFHMPLFMLLCGYLFWYTLSKYSLWNGLLAKIKGIMIPCMVWGLVTYLLDVAINGWRPISLYGYLYYTVYSNWFLWAVFYCSMIGFVSKYFFKSTWIGYAIILICNYLLPAFANTVGAKRLMPFFIMGIVINQYKVLDKIRKTNTKVVVFVCLFVAYIMSMIFVPDIELFTGSFGSLLVCFVFWIISDYIKLDVFEKLGQVSIGIYLFTGIVFYFLIKDYCRVTEGAVKK